MLTGVLLASVYPPALKFVATWFVKGRGIAFGCVIGALTLGSAMPHAINALGGLGWRGVIVATSLCAFAGTALVLLALRDGPYPFPKAGFRPSEVRAALSDRRFVLCTIGYLGHMWELYAMWSWLLFFVTDRLKALGHPDSSWASALTFIVIAAGTPACVAAGAIADTLGRSTTTIALLAISGLCAATIGFAFDAPGWVFLLVGLVWGASVVADSAQFSAIVTESGATFVGTALTVQLGLGFGLTVAAILILPSVAALGRRLAMGVPRPRSRPCRRRPSPWRRCVGWGRWHLHKRDTRIVRRAAAGCQMTSVARRSSGVSRDRPETPARA